MLFKQRGRPAVLAACLALAACTTMPPNEPSVMVLPGTGKSFEQFQSDNDMCKQFAFGQVSGGTPQNAAVDSGVRSAALGTLLGAAAGAAANGSHGAGAGAGIGLALGGLVGSGTGETSGLRLQQRYDIGYQQCMYARGHRIPMASGSTSTYFHDYHLNPAVPPPPPGTVVR